MAKRRGMVEGLACELWLRDGLRDWFVSCGWGAHLSSRWMERSSQASSFWTAMNSFHFNFFIFF